MNTLFKLSGKVTPYTGNGRRMGYPTANIEIPANTKEGLFVGHVELNNKLLPSIIFVGAPVTLGDPNKRGEAHILDFEDKDLYGEEVTFFIEKKLRDNQKYESEEKLIQQMNQDKIDAYKYFEGDK